MGLNLILLQDVFAICRLEGDARIPDWAEVSGFTSITRTSDELTVVCPQTHVPGEVVSDKGWRCLKVEGPLDLSLTGVLASLVTPLAHAGISVFAISTYDTDYLMVKQDSLPDALRVLERAGHQVRS